ncbi:taste receptor type 2 member 113-like [Thomomys bottae]
MHSSPVVCPACWGTGTGCPGGVSGQDTVSRDPRGMEAVPLSLLTLVLSVEIIVGYLANGLIALVNCVDGVRRRTLSLVDRILTALAVSRVILLTIVALDWVVTVRLLPEDFWKKEKARSVFYIAWTLANHFSMWLATSLSLFYFLKIATFSSSVFLFLKFRVGKVVSVTLLLSVVLVFLNVTVLDVYLHLYMDEIERNRTGHSHSSAHTLRLLSFTNPLFTLVPFSVSLVTFLLILCSLWKHLRRMKLRARGCSVAAHTKALHTVIASLLLYSVFLSAVFVKVWSSAEQETLLVPLFSRTAAAAFPSAHSCILVLGNRKLRAAWLCLLHYLTCRRRGPCGPQIARDARGVF